MAQRIDFPERALNHLTEWYSTELLESTTILRGSIFGWLFGWFGQHAVTINGTVHLTSRAPDLDSDRGVRLIGHELFHVSQQQEMGWWRFLAKYVWSWRPTHINNGRSHPMEQPAYERRDAIMASLQE